MGIFGRKKEPVTGVTEVIVKETVVETAPPPAAPKRVTAEAWQAEILDAITPMPPSGMQLLDAIELTLSETLVSDLDLPVVNTALVDGYAIRTDDTRGAAEVSPVGLQVVAVDSEVDVIPPKLPPIATMRVKAGAPLPEGADTVVKAADATVSNSLMIVIEEPARGQNLSWQGSDLGEGATLATKGDVLTPAKLALVAEAGIDKILVRMPPRIVLLNCVPGSVEPGVPLANVLQRYAATTVLLAACARKEGAEVYVVDATMDDAEAIWSVLNEQLIRADLVVMNGGLGAEGAVRQLAATKGVLAEVELQGAVDQGFAQVGFGETPVLMVPEDPYGAFVSFEMFIRPVIRKLVGSDPLERKAYQAQVLSTFATEPGVNCLPGFAAAEGVKIVGDPKRPLATSLADANALIVVPAEIDRVEAGFVTECWMLDDSQ